jgi:hypothetical protein
MSSDSTIKEVKVALNPVDEKALSRTSTRRRRTSRKATEDQEGGAEPLTNTIQKAAEVSATPTPTPQPSASPTQAPQLPTTVTPATSMGGGGVQKVKIAAKKGGQTLKAPSSVIGGAKLLPKKRISSAPAATLKKPRIPIRAAPQIAPRAKQGGAILDVPTTPSMPLEPPKPALSSTTVVGGAVPSVQKKRRFTERKISIDMKQAASTRKQRKFVKSRIATMPIATVKKMLIRKGLLKSKTSAPPEAMMRNMLKDYFLLHAAE